MNDFSNAMSIAASGMTSQSSRLRFVSENIANTDTPGYRRKLTEFEAVHGAGHAAGEVALGDVRLDQSELPRIFDPSHPMADDEGYYLGSNVDLVIEMADAREAQRSYEANLRMFDQSRQMSSAVLDLLRR